MNARTVLSLRRVLCHVSRRTRSEALLLKHTAEVSPLVPSDALQLQSLYLLIESVRPDTKHPRDSNDPAHADGAGGSPTD
jgi:hypothetical protein